MLHTALIVIHAASGTAGFLFGSWALLWRHERHRSLALSYLIALWGMVLFLGIVLGIDWAGLQAANRILFSALFVLALYTGWRGWSAFRNLANASGTRNTSLIDDIGFTLITLFAGFVIIASLDLGAPIWLVVAIGLGGILGGRQVIESIKAGEERGQSPSGARHSAA